MKKILTIIGFLWTATLWGQSDSTQLKNLIENQFNYIDSSNIKTGYLLNKSPFTDFARIFDTLSGNIKHKTYVFTKRDWRIMYGSLYISNFKRKNVLPRIDNIAEFRKSNFDKTKPIIPIGINVV